MSRGVMGERGGMTPNWRRVASEQYETRATVATTISGSWPVSDSESGKGVFLLGQEFGPAGLSANKQFAGPTEGRRGRFDGA